jgi:hypothetical protein
MAEARHAPASRREILAAAAGGAAALAAGALAKPLPVDAASSALMTEVDNPTTLETSVTATLSAGTGDELVVAFESNVNAAFVGVRGYSPDGRGVLGDSDHGHGIAGRLGDTGPNIGYPPAGVLGVSAVGDSSGVYAEGVVGVDAFGQIGVLGLGGTGVVGIGDGLGPPGLYGTGVYGHAGASATPVPPTNVGVYARGDGSATALRVQGKAVFSRSGRTYVAANRSYRVVTLAGVTSASLVLVTLQSRRTGVYVVAAVPAAGKFTVYLNKAVTATTYFAYMVLN